MQTGRFRFLVVAVVLGLGLVVACLALFSGTTVVFAENDLVKEQYTPPSLIPPAQAGTGIIRVAMTGVDISGCGNVITPCLTIQYAVDQAVTGDEVRIAAGTYTHVQMRAGVTQSVYISKSVVLRGGYTVTNWLVPSTETNPTVLNALRAGRVVYIFGNGITAEIENLGITGGDATGLGGGLGSEDAGGGIYADSATVVLTNNHIYSNTASVATGFSVGGGAYLQNGQATLISNTIKFNQANANLTGPGSGGGVELYANPVTFINNKIITNTASVFFDGSGGAVSGGAEGALNLTFTGNLISGNVAGGNGLSSSFGGGLSLGVGSQSAITLTDNIIQGNSASLGIGNGQGGGIYIYNYAVQMRGNKIVGNMAALSPVSQGGGLFISSGSLTMQQDVVQHNSAGNGGGLYQATGFSLFPATMTNVVFADNTITTGAGQRGAGMVLDWALLTGNHLTVARNRGGDGSGVTVSGNGSGFESTLNLTNTIIVSHTVGVSVTSLFGEVNTANLNGVLWFGNTTNAAGEINSLFVTNAYTGNPAFKSDGFHIALNSAALDRGVPTTVRTDIDDESRPYRNVPDLGADEWLASCRARPSNGVTDGPVYNTIQAAVDAATPLSHTVKVSGYCVGVETKNSLTQTVYISKNITIRGGYTGTNWGISRPISYPTVLDAQGAGRVAYIEAGTAVTFENISLINGKTVGNGGGIYHNGANLTLLTNTLVSNNVATTTLATGSGGGVYAASGAGNLLLQGAKISGNLADSGGGVFVNLGVAFRQESGAIVNNYALATGGGAYIFDSDARLNGGQIFSNTATDSGGGLFIYNNVGNTALNGVEIISNRVISGTGGGVQIEMAAVGGGVQMNGGQIANNLAHRGGGVFINDRFTQSAGAITHNDAIENGGGVFINNGQMLISGGQIISNVASFGGGVYLLQEGAALTQTSLGTVALNLATGDGGGIYMAAGSATLSGNIFSNSAGNTGGGLYLNQGTATLTGTHLFNNSAVNGGGLYNNGTLAIRNGFVVSNTATVDGGGIFNGLTGVISQSSVSENKAGSSGGGIFNRGNLNIVDGSTIAGNTSTDGGSLYNFSGTALLQHTTVSSNTAHNNGGGLHNTSEAAVMTLTSTTISYNKAMTYGGAIFNDGESLTVINSTISQNYADSLTGSDGAALFNALGVAVLTNTTVSSNVSGLSTGSALRQTGRGSLVLRNTIVAYNRGGGGNCGGLLTSLGYNLADDASCPAFTFAGDITNIDPLLGPLAVNGGLPALNTHVLLTGSPAIDAGACDLSADQRGESRPGSGSPFCDIGAVERQMVGFNLAVSKQVVGNTVVAPGEALTYTLTFTNSGSAKAGQILISDTIPSSLVTATFSYSGAVITAQRGIFYRWDVADLPGGNDGIITITGIISAAIPLGTAVDNRVVITSNATFPDEDLTNNADTAPTVIVGIPGIVVSLPTNGINVSEEGVSSSYSLMLTSPPRQPVRIDVTTDGQTTVLPSSLDFTEANWLTPQQVNVFAVDDTLPEYFHTALLTNTATSLDTDYDGRILTVTTTITDNDVAADLSVLKTAPSAVVLGNKISYVIFVTNHGPWPVTNLVITDTLPGSSIVGLEANRSFAVDYTAQFNPPLAAGGGQLSAAAVTCNTSQNIFTCLVDDLIPNGTMLLNLELTPESLGVLVNNVVVRADEPDPGPNPNSDTVTTTVGLAAIDLALTQRAATNLVVAGEPLVYTLNITNTGSDTAFGVTLLDSLPAGFDVTGPVLTSQGSCSVSNAVINCGLGTINSSATVQISFTAVPTLAYNLPTVITNTATVAVGIGTDVNLSNNSASVTTTVIPVSVDLSVTKLVSSDVVFVGNTLVYTLNVAAANIAEGVTVFDTLPDGFLPATAVPSQGACSNGNPVVCTLGTVTSAGAQIIIAGTAISPGTITNTALVTTSFAFDPLPGNNTSLPVVTAISQIYPDLTLNKVASSSSITVGHALVYTLTVTNAPGADPAFNVIITDTLPSGILFSQAVADSGSCRHLDGIVTCNLGSIAAGGSRQVLLEVIPTLVASITNTAVVTPGSGAEANPLDNTGQATVNVVGIGSTISPTLDSTLVYTDSQGNVTEIFVPAGAVTSTVKLEFNPVTLSQPPMVGRVSTGHAFTLEAYSYPGHVLLPKYVFNRPVTVTINYSANDVEAVADENSLVLYYLNGTLWLDAATTCTPKSLYQRNIANRQISVAICHFTEFGLFGSAANDSPMLYLPLILKDDP